MISQWKLRSGGLYYCVLLLLLHCCIGEDNTLTGNDIKDQTIPNTNAEAGQTKEALVSEPEKTPQQQTPEQLFQRLLRHKRMDHVEAVNTILNLDDYEKQHKIISLLLDKLFKVLTDSQVKLMSMGFSPGDPFSTNETIRDAFSNVVENTAFFGDLVLRLPDIVHDIMKRKKDWGLLIQWGVGFCNMADIFEEKDARLLNLMSQELGITEKDPSYINPYKKENLKKASVNSKEDLAEYTRQVLRKQQKKKQREKRKGPRLSGARNEL